MMGAPLFGYNVSRIIHSGLNSGVKTGLCLCNEYLFFGLNEGKLETFTKICVAASLVTLHEDPTVRVRDKQADWKLLSKISRTAPDFVCVEAIFFQIQSQLLSILHKYIKVLLLRLTFLKACSHVFPPLLSVLF